MSDLLRDSSIDAMELNMENTEQSNNYPNKKDDEHSNKEAGQPHSSNCEDMETSDDEKKGMKRKRRSLTLESTVADIGLAFFSCMDFNGNGFIEEEESTMLSIISFNMTQEEAKAQWKEMLSTMDIDKDEKISKSEYIQWWMMSSVRQAEENAESWSSDNNNNNNNNNNNSAANKFRMNADGEVIFERTYAISLLESLQRIMSIKTAKNVCDAFFDAMDYNKNGFLEEEEVKSISKWAFGAKSQEAEATWLDMLQKMDTNHDSQVSKEEYSSYWMSQTKDKIQPDGTFIKGYRHFLLKKLAKIKAGNRRQEQVRKWEQEYTKPSNAGAHVATKISFVGDTAPMEVSTSTDQPKSN